MRYTRMVLDGKHNVLKAPTPHKHDLPCPDDTRLEVNSKTRCACGAWFSLGSNALYGRAWRPVSRSAAKKFEREWSR